MKMDVKEGSTFRKVAANSLEIVDAMCRVGSLEKDVTSYYQTAAGARGVGHAKTEAVVGQGLFLVRVVSPLEWWFVGEAEAKTENECRKGIKGGDAG